VTATPAAADALHRTARVAVGRVADSADAIAAAALEPPPQQRGGLKLLLLGTVNTPHVEHMATAMRDRGHRVIVAGDVTPAYAPSVLPAAGIPVRQLELPAALWLRRLGRTERPDVVHANWLPSYAFLAAVVGLRPLVAMAWGSDVYGATRAQQRRSRFALKRADVAMSDSKDLVEEMIRLGADADATFVANWGVDLEVFTPAEDRTALRRRLGLGDGQVVLSPRAVAPIYNTEVIADAFADATRDVAGAQLVLKHIGKDPPDFKRPLPPCTYVIGHVPYDELANYFRAADICVSIPDSDSSPRSVWEAMASGCACVISDLPWAHELIVDGKHALLVPPTRDAVASALRRLLTDPGLAREIGRHARTLVERHRDERTEMNRLSRLYESLVS
jgi:glycosyltransferase involved in cell wall biosynthesis